MSPLAQLWQTLPQRLAGSRPEHRLDHARFGSDPATRVDPRLLALLPAQLRPAAVLVGLLESSEGPGVLLTVRAANLRMHAGQIAFPGGTIDATDHDVVATALREAQEEVGLDPASAEVLGFLPDQFVLTGYRITPVVARLPAAFEARLQSAEVQESFLLPFERLMDPASEHASVRQVGGVPMPARDLHYRDYRIWGATAGVLFSLREVVSA